MNWDWSTLASIKGRKTAGQGASGRRDRYAKVTAVTSTQRKLQAYLQEAFAGQMILLSQPLARLVSVEQADDLERAQQRLRDHVIDFVVCDAQGQAAWAFQVESSRDGDEAARRDLAVKHRVLSTAGVRLLRLKKSVRHLPPPAELRDKLLATQQSARDDDDAGADESAAWLDNVPVLTKAIRVDQGGRLVTETLTPVRPRGAASMVPR